MGIWHTEAEELQRSLKKSQRALAKRQKAFEKCRKKYIEAASDLYPTTNISRFRRSSKKYSTGITCSSEVPLYGLVRDGTRTRLLTSLPDYYPGVATCIDATTGQPGTIALTGDEVVPLHATSHYYPTHPIPISAYFNSYPPSHSYPSLGHPSVITERTWYRRPNDTTYDNPYRVFTKDGIDSIFNATEKERLDKLPMGRGLLPRGDPRNQWKPDPIDPTKASDFLPGNAFDSEMIEETLSKICDPSRDVHSALELDLADFVESSFKDKDSRRMRSKAHEWYRTRISEDSTYRDQIKELVVENTAEADDALLQEFIHWTVNPHQGWPAVSHVKKPTTSRPRYEEVMDMYGVPTGYNDHERKVFVPYAKNRSGIGTGGFGSLQPSSIARTTLPQNNSGSAMPTYRYPSGIPSYGSPSTGSQFPSVQANTNPTGPWSSNPLSFQNPSSGYQGTYTTPPSGLPSYDQGQPYQPMTQATTPGSMSNKPPWDAQGTTKWLATRPTTQQSSTYPFNFGASSCGPSTLFASSAYNPFAGGSRPVVGSVY